MTEAAAFQMGNFCEDLISKACPTAFNTVSPLSSFESDFYQSVRFFVTKHTFSEAQRILDVPERFLNVIKTTLTQQLNTLIQRNVAGIRLKDIDLLLEIPTNLLSPQERLACRNRTDADEMLVSLAKQYLLAVREYARISPQLARSQFLISHDVAEHLSYLTSGQVMNVCDRASPALRFELTAPVNMYVKSIETGNAFSLVAKQAVSLSKVMRELYSTTLCLKVLANEPIGQ